jgi:hypothetical protein
MTAGAGKTRTVGVAVLPVCDAIGCLNLADWFHRDQSGEILLCAFHGGTEPVEGWEWIGE